MPFLFLVLAVPIVGIGVHAFISLLLWVDERVHAWARTRRELRRLKRVDLRHVTRPINAIRRDPSPHPKRRTAA